MKINILFFVIFFIEWLIFLSLALIFKNRDKKTFKRCNQIVKGKVVKYTLSNNNGVHFPIVEYIVNNISYNQRLKYSWIIMKSSSFKNINTEIKNDLSDSNLVTSKNSHISTNVLKDKFPIGTELDVYYNPSNPKESYVLRFTKNPCIKVFLIVSISFITLSLIGLVLLPNNLIK